MTATTLAKQSTPRQLPLAQRFDIVGLALPIAALIAMFAYTDSLNARTLTYGGLDLILSTAVPLVFAALAQALVIALGDIDLSVGYFIGLVNVIVAVEFSHHALLGVLMLVGLVVAYGLEGLLISWRKLPSITFTLGASFVWLGLGQLVAPTPSGVAPTWLTSFFSIQTPVLPLSVWLIVAACVIGYVVFFRTRIGLMIRAAGSNESAYTANGANMVRIKTAAYVLAALFAVAAGLAVTASTGSGDATASADYTLLTIAAVILGGGSFKGGTMSAVGVVAGALVLSLVGSVLAQVNISSNLQTGAEGVVLMLAIAGRRIFSGRKEV